MTSPADSVGERLPWRRLALLLRPSRGPLAALVLLGAVGSAAGVVPALAAAAVIDRLAGTGRGGIALVPALVLIAAVLLCETGCYVAADTLYNRVAGRFARDLRVQMFAGAESSFGRNGGPKPGDRGAGIASRFISDAELPAEMAVGTLDLAVGAGLTAMAALAAVAFLDLMALPIVVGLGIAALLLGRRLQRSLGDLAEERQEALEEMGEQIAAALAQRRAGRTRFLGSVERLYRLDVRLGWLQARGAHIPGLLTGAGSFAVVLAAAAAGEHHAGSLLALFALAGRALAASDDLLEVNLDVELVRGAISRCFELIDRAQGRVAAHESASLSPVSGTPRVLVER